MTENLSQQRLRFDRAELRNESDQECVVDVMLSFAEQEVRGSVRGDSTGTGPLKTAATAALQAIEDAAGRKFTCTLADVDHVNVLGKNLIAVLVDVAFEGRQVQVFGSCQIAGNEIDASVKATLNATNRFFELATRG